MSKNLLGPVCCYSRNKRSNENLISNRPQGGRKFCCCHGYQWITFGNYQNPRYNPISRQIMTFPALKRNITNCYSWNLLYSPFCNLPNSWVIICFVLVLRWQSFFRFSRTNWQLTELMTLIFQYQAGFSLNLYATCDLQGTSIYEGLANKQLSLGLVELYWIMSPGSIWNKVIIFKCQTEAELYFAEYSR